MDAFRGVGEMGVFLDVTNASAKPIETVSIIGG
jgi:hypothetical protein